MIRSAMPPRKAGLKAPTIQPSGKRMRQSRSTGTPTKVQAARFEAMRALGCIACRMNAGHGLPTATFGSNNLEIQHLLSGGRRIGHDATVCLCHYHHQGKRLPVEGDGYCAHGIVFGPSFGHEPSAFRLFYGREAEQLEYQNALLGSAA
jgi:hypothetical protein